MWFLPLSGMLFVTGMLWGDNRHSLKDKIGMTLTVWIIYLAGISTLILFMKEQQ